MLYCLSPKTKTLISNETRNKKIQKRTMFSGVMKTSNKVLTQSCLQSKPTRSFAACAGKTKMDSKVENILNERLVKNVINNHAQFITDFNIIYEDPTNIQLYSIASLHTKVTEGSYTVSKTTNYKHDTQPQQIKFHDTLVPVKNNLYIVKKSRQYFENSEIKKNIEETDNYKQLFNKVIEELNTKGVKYHIAKTYDEMQQTGFNVLLKDNHSEHFNNLFDILKRKQHDKFQE